MDYSKINKIDIDGKGNIVLQDVNGTNITVNYNDTAEFSKLLSLSNDKLLSNIQELIQNKENQTFENILKKYLDLPPEIKKEKEKLTKKIETLSHKLSELSIVIKQNKENEIISTNFENININWYKLINAIKSGDCVLFIGQEISVDKNGTSLQKNIFEDFGNKYEIGYLEKESFFEPVDNVELKIMINDIAENYETLFYQNNGIALKLLQKFAKIPFSLIISMTPDNTMHRIFEKYDKTHQYLYNKGEKQETLKPTKENPIIYNILGEIEKREYIFSHEQFYDYLRNINIDKNIKLKLKKATHFIFIGFDFNKWHKRLLLFILDITRKSGKSYRHVIENTDIDDDFKNIVEKQFNLTFINQKYAEFADQLLLKSSAENEVIDLENNFIASNFEKITYLSNKLTDNNKLEDFIEINITINQIENKIKKFQKNL